MRSELMNAKAFLIHSRHWNMVALVFIIISVFLYKVRHFFKQWSWDINNLQAFPGYILKEFRCFVYQLLERKSSSHMWFLLTWVPVTHSGHSKAFKYDFVYLKCHGRSWNYTEENHCQTFWFSSHLKTANSTHPSVFCFNTHFLSEAIPFRLDSSKWSHVHVGPNPFLLHSEEVTIAPSPPALKMASGMPPFTSEFQAG